MSLCNCSMNSYARKFEIQFLDTEELVQRTHARPETKHRSQPSTKLREGLKYSHVKCWHLWCLFTVFSTACITADKHFCESIHEQNKPSVCQVPMRHSLSILVMFNHRLKNKSLQVSLHHTPPVFNGLYWHCFFRDIFCLYYSESLTHLWGIQCLLKAFRSKMCDLS